MSITERQLTEFFDTYQEGANTFDPDTIRAGAAEVRLGVTPSEVSALTWADDYRERIAARHRWLLDRGYKPGRVTSVETVPIDERHALANTTWESLYERIYGDEVAIEFHVSYLLREEPDGLKVLVYISHEDETQLLAEHGLLEAAQDVAVSPASTPST